MSKGGKLHQLLGVEGDLKAGAEKITGETINTFRKKEGLFSGFERHMKWLTDEFKNEPVHASEFNKMDSTIQQKLDYMSDSVIRYYDALLQKEATNQVAKADVIIGGETLLEGMPATWLLGMESRLESLRKVYDSIPTLSTSDEWKEKEGEKDVYVQVHPVEDFVTKTETGVDVLYPHKFPKAGEEGGQSIPAQIVKTSVTRNVGVKTKTIWSGLIYPADKSAMLGRIDALIRAVKDARQRANSTKVVNETAAKIMLDFIHGK